MLARLEMDARGLGRKYFPRKSMPGLGYDPYDVDVCKQIADRLLEDINSQPQKSPLESCRRLIEAIGVSYPTTKLSNQYFEKLEILLNDMRPLETPGQLVIGV